MRPPAAPASSVRGEQVAPPHRIVGLGQGAIRATLWTGPTEASVVVREVLRAVFRLADIPLDVVPTGDELLALAAHAHRNDIAIIDCFIGMPSDADRCVTIAAHTTLAVHVVHPRQQAVRDLEQVVGRALVWWPADFTVFSLLDKLYMLRALAFTTAAERPALTPREQEVVELIATGHSNRKISTRLHITEDTAKTHVRNVMHKFHATSRREIIAAFHGGELEEVIPRVRAPHQG
jgi:DNA-binding NarL/FixJ family response regulator